MSINASIHCDHCSILCQQVNVIRTKPASASCLVCDFSSPRVD